MKKRFTLILASMFLAMGAWAQLGDGVYTIKNVIDNRGTLVAVDGQTNVGAADITLSGYADKSETAMTDGDKWYVCTVEDNVFLYNVANGKFLNSRQGNPVQFTETPVTGFTLTANGNYYVIAHGNYKVSCCPGWDKGQTVRWLTDNEANSQHLTFTPVENGTTEYKAAIDNANKAIEALNGYSFVQNYSTVASWRQSPVYPNGLKTATASDSHGNAATHVGANGHTIYKSVKAVTTNGNNVNVTFTYASGNSHGLTILGVDAVNGNGDVVASDYHVGFTGGSQDNNEYTLTSIEAGNYILRYYVCDKSGDHALSATGGTITVTGAKEIAEVATISAMLETLKGEVPTAKGEGLGYYDTAETEAAEALANTEVTGDEVASYVAAFVALDDAIDDITFYTPTPGKFYRLQGKSSGNWMNAAKDNTNIGMKSDKEEDPTATVFYLTENNKLLSFKLGTFLMNTHSIGAVGETNGNTVFFNPSESGNGGYFTLKTDYSDSKYVYDYTSKVDRNAEYQANNCEWKVEEVTYLPVAVSNTLKFGTLYSPVALSTTEKWSAGKIKAYTGTIDGDYLVLTEIDGDIPANTPVVVEYIGGDYKNGCAFLKIIDDVDAVEVDNDLDGGIATTAKAGNPYSLQSHEGGVAFKKFTGDNLKGFKAYLDLPTEAPAIGIRFEDGTTGIDNSELTIQNSELIFDLMGRRVETMIEGNIYIVNGKKVIR